MALALASAGVLAHLSAWLTAKELCRLRLINRQSHHVLPQLTWELTVEHVRHPQTLGRLATMFPFVRTLRLRRVIIASQRLQQALINAVSTWMLKHLELNAVWYLTDAHIGPVLDHCRTLEVLLIRQCAQLRAPCIRGDRLRSVSIYDCPVEGFNPATQWPELIELHISSRALTTLGAHYLVKKLLAHSRIQRLDLAHCNSIEQLLIDPSELPELNTVCLKSCIQLSRVHVASQLLETLDLTLCVELEFLILELPKISALDLSYLPMLSHLFLHAESLRMLSLQGCTDLQRKDVQVLCPELLYVLLHGTALTLEDMNREQAIEGQ